MRFEYTQGLAYNTTASNFLERNVTGGVDISIPKTSNISVIFSHGEGNYLVEQGRLAKAWNFAFSDTSSYWLYFDIDVLDAKLTYGFTTLAPKFGLTRPSTPTTGENFFDKNINKMLEWNGGRWIEKIRVFAGSLKNGNLTTNSSRTQVDAHFDVNAENISLFNASHPSRIEFGNGDFIFLTNGDSINDINSFKFKRLDYPLIAARDLPQYTAVMLDDNGELVPATNREQVKEAIGIVDIEYSAGDDVLPIIRGFISDPSFFAFSESAMWPLFTDDSGAITPTAPTTSALQKIGFVVNVNTMYVDITPKLLIIGVTPPNVTVTPTLTPSATVTPTPTVTPTVTPSPSPSV